MGRRTPIGAGGAGGGTGAITVADDHFFESDVARDAYFTSNPDELVTGLYVVVSGQLQKYDGTDFIDYSAVVRGPAGADGNTDYKIMVSPSDGEPGYLRGKLVEGDNITISINPDTGSGETITVASAGGIPAGGSIGQVLEKLSGTDYAVTWGDKIHADAMVFKGAIDCSTNPDYPAAVVGDTYKISVDGKIGGASGPDVTRGDVIICVEDTVSGDHATVGSKWTVIGGSTEGAVSGPVNSVDSNFAAFDGVTGGVIKDSGYSPDDFVADDDSRLTDARDPNAHASSHVSTGDDPIANAVASVASGLLSGADKAKLDGIADNANNYSLPTASAEVLGGIKVGANLSIAEGVLSAESGGVTEFIQLSDTPGSYGLENVGKFIRVNAAHDGLEFADGYSLPTASAEVLGGVKIGSGITITDGVISAEGGGGITWNEVTGTTQSAAADNGYIANNEALVTVTLPSTCAVGKVVHVAGKGAGGWKIAQNAGQSIVYGNVSSTTGTGGSVSSTHARDCIGLLCTVADSEFMVFSWVGTVEVV